MANLTEREGLVAYLAVMQSIHATRTILKDRLARGYRPEELVADIDKMLKEKVDDPNFHIDVKRLIEQVIDNYIADTPQYPTVEAKKGPTWKR